MAKRVRNYQLDAGATGKTFPAPNLPYEPRPPRRYRPPIAVIGTGGIADMHLSAYRDAGLNVVALCNRTPAKAVKLGRRFFPAAKVYRDTGNCSPATTSRSSTSPPTRTSGRTWWRTRSGPGSTC